MYIMYSSKQAYTYISFCMYTDTNDQRPTTLKTYQHIRQISTVSNFLNNVFSSSYFRLFPAIIIMYSLGENQRWD